MLEWVSNHGVTAMIIMWVASNAVGTMPSPADGDSKFYKWAFGFLTSLLGGLPRVLNTLAPKFAARFSTLSGAPRSK